MQEQAVCYCGGFHFAIASDYIICTNCEKRYEFTVADRAHELIEMVKDVRESMTPSKDGE